MLRLNTCTLFDRDLKFKKRQVHSYSNLINVKNTLTTSQTVFNIYEFKTHLTHPLAKEKLNVHLDLDKNFNFTPQK